MVKVNETLSNDDKVNIYYDTIEKIERLFNDSYIWYDIYDTKQRNTYYTISLEIDGDWKHSHLYADKIVKDNFDTLIKVEEYETGESESDDYTVVHKYMFKY